MDEALSWLDRNQLGEKEEYTEKQKELEADLKVLMEKLCSAGGQDQAGDQQDCKQQARQGQKEPTIEEVD